MTIIMHPLTAKNGSPEYTADDYRHAINPLLVPSDGSAFNGLSGIRYGSPSPLVTVSGLTATVKPHCGTISPWDGLGAYTYAITTNTTVQLMDSTNDYKIAVTVEDPSQSHGTTPRGKIEVFTAGTPDSNINGLVIAEVNAGVASDAAPMIRNNAILMARDLEQLNTIAAMDGQEAVTIADNAHYVRNDGTWKGYDFIKSTAIAKCASYANDSNWYEFSVDSITNMSGTASTDYSLGKEGSKGYLRVNRNGMYTLNGFVNVSELGVSGNIHNIGFRTAFSDNAWVFSLPSPVYVDNNAVTSKSYTSLTVPTMFAYIKTGTRITLGFDSVFARRIGSMTNFQIRRIG
nr:MAG TPA: hypothetical protein [Caudoviricetes sp.]